MRSQGKRVVFEGSRGAWKTGRIVDWEHYQHEGFDGSVILGTGSARDDGGCSEVDAVLFDASGDVVFCSSRSRIGFGE